MHRISFILSFLLICQLQAQSIVYTAKVVREAEPYFLLTERILERTDSMLATYGLKRHDSAIRVWSSTSYMPNYRDSVSGGQLNLWFRWGHGYKSYNLKPADKLKQNRVPFQNENGYYIDEFHIGGLGFDLTRDERLKPLITDEIVLEIKALITETCENFANNTSMQQGVPKRTAMFYDEEIQHAFLQADSLRLLFNNSIANYHVDEWRKEEALLDIREDVIDYEFRYANGAAYGLGDDYIMWSLYLTFYNQSISDNRINFGGCARDLPHMNASFSNGSSKHHENITDIGCKMLAKFVQQKR